MNDKVRTLYSNHKVAENAGDEASKCADKYLVKKYHHDKAVREMSESEHEDTVEDRPLYILHPLRGVVWAAFWGTPLAAGIIMAINYWRIGRKSAARNVAVLGVIATVALFAFIFIIPEDELDTIPNTAFIVPQLVLAYILAKILQNDLIKKHIANGGVIASAWPSVGIGALCL